MASEPILDIEELLAPIPGDDPAGEPPPYDVREKLETGRKEVNPADFDDDDPMRPTDAVKADWPGIQRLATETLTGKSKDLLIAARLTEALVKRYGFAGLRDGLTLMTRMVDECWDRIHPRIEEEEDLELRAAPFHWLDDPDRGARFPNSIRMIPLVFGKTGQYGWLEFRQSQDGRGDVSREDFEAAVVATPEEKARAIFDDIQETVEQLKKLLEVVNGKLGPLAPGMTELRKAVLDCQTLVQQILQRRGIKPDAVGQSQDGEEETSATGQVSRSSGGNGSLETRDDVYRQLSVAADVLQRLEPHSPIPYLIRRAVELGGMPFPQLIKQLVRENAVLEALNREMGIKDEEAASSSEEY